MKRVILGLTVFILLAGGSQVQANLIIPLANPSFEYPDLPLGFSGFGVPGWFITFPPFDVGIENEGAYGAPSGLSYPLGDHLGQHAFLGGFSGNANLFQDVTSPIIGDPANLSYTFTIGLGIRTFFGEANSGAGHINVGIHDLNSGPVVITAIPRILLFANLGSYVDISVTLPAETVLPGDTLRVFIDRFGDGNYSSLVVADNARFVANVAPEPSTLTLFAIGVLGLAGYGLRKRR